MLGFLPKIATLSWWELYVNQIRWWLNFPKCAQCMRTLKIEHKKSEMLIIDESLWYKKIRKYSYPNNI